VTSLPYIRGREDKLKVWALDKLGTNFVQTPTPRVWVTGFVSFIKDKADGLSLDCSALID
jgi:hypothetical protein